MCHRSNHRWPFELGTISKNKGVESFSVIVKLEMEEGEGGEAKFLERNNFLDFNIDRMFITMTISSNKFIFLRYLILIEMCK